MSKQKVKKYIYDISLEEGAGAHMVSWVTGLMVFFVTLALLVNLSLSTITKNWVTGLSGTLTVEIKPPAISSAQDKKTVDASVRKIMAFLKDNPAVSEARPLADSEIKTLIQPWLGQGVNLDGVALPTLIDIKLSSNADMAKLQSDLKALDPTATIDSHSDTLDDVKSLVSTATLFVFLLTVVIVFLAIIAISGIVRSKLIIHQPEVETLHLVGASDEYIARQFRQYILQGTLKGTVIGLICTFALLFGIAHITHTLDENIFFHMRWMPLQWVVLVIAPIAAGGIVAHLTAQATVLKELSRLT